MTSYLKDPEAIYARSFAMVRAEADLDRFPGEITEVAVRLIHACGIVDIAQHIAYTDAAVHAGRQALKDGAPILVDAEMVAAGIIRRHLSRSEIICTLNDDGVAEAAVAAATTRSAAAVERWAPMLSAAGAHPSSDARSMSCSTWLAGQGGRP